MMPGFLRLNSVGENSSAGSVKLNNSGGHKNISQSPRTKSFLSKSTMATMKSLSMNNSRQPYYEPTMPLTKANSFSGATKPQAYSLLFKPFSSSFDSDSRTSPVTMFQLIMPYKNKSYQFMTSGRSLSETIDTTVFTGVKSCVNAMEKQTSTQSLKNQPSSVSAIDIQAFAPGCSSECVVSLQSEFPTSASKMKDSASNMKIIEYDKSLSSVSTTSSSDNLELDPNFEKGISHSREQSSSSRFLNCSLQNEHVSSNTDKEKVEIESVMDNSSSHCPTKLINNPALILSTPRKIAKKGRPSSKKQKKRQREKRRHESPPLQSSEFSDPSQVTHEVNNAPCESLRNTVQKSSSLGQKISSKFENACIKLSSPMADSGKWCPASKFFFRANSTSEDVDDEGEDIDGNSENNYEDSVFPIQNFGFNCGLSLDSIFKQKNIPSLKSVFVRDESNEAKLATLSSISKANTSHIKYSESQSKEDNAEAGSDEYCGTNPPSRNSYCDFPSGLSFDILFPQRSSKTQNSANLTETSLDFLGGSSSKNRFLPSSSLEADLETLNKINAKWNEHYSSSGFRSCQPDSVGEIQDPSVKVHFAKEPHFLTVHVVGTEDRYGTWHHFALDRERFERRITELETVISPVLEASHRAKILRNLNKK